MKQKTFPQHLWEEYGKEVRARLPEFREKHTRLRSVPPDSFPTIKRKQDGMIGGTASFADCIYLYLLIRHFKPDNIFEIGTWIGTSALFMAEAVRKNGNGHIYTCDRNDFYTLPPEYDTYITRFTTMSDEALDRLPRDVSIDFVFTDGEITPPTLTRLTRRMSDTTVIASHDFKLSGQKGLRNLALIQRSHDNSYYYVLPRDWPHDLPVETSTLIGVLLPPSVFQQYNLSKRPTALMTFVFLVLVRMRSLYRKLRKLFLLFFKKLTTLFRGQRRIDK